MQFSWQLGLEQRKQFDLNIFVFKFLKYLLVIQNHSYVWYWRFQLFLLIIIYLPSANATELIKFNNMIIAILSNFTYRTISIWFLSQTAVYVSNQTLDLKHFRPSIWNKIFARFFLNRTQVINWCGSLTWNATKVRIYLINAYTFSLVHFPQPYICYLPL